MSRRAISLIAHFPFSSAILFLLLLFELLFFFLSFLWQAEGVTCQQRNNSHHDQKLVKGTDGRKLSSLLSFGCVCGRGALLSPF